MTTENAKTWRRVFSAALLIGTGFVVSAPAPVLAQQPRTPTYGYQQRQDRDRDRRDWNDRRDSRDNDRRDRRDNDRWNSSRDSRDKWDRNHDWDYWRNRRDIPWDYRDSDGDGVRNRWDRYPYNSRRH